MQQQEMRNDKHPTMTTVVTETHNDRKVIEKTVNYTTGKMESISCSMIGIQDES